MSDWCCREKVELARVEYGGRIGYLWAVELQNAVDGRKVDLISLGAGRQGGRVFTVDFPPAVLEQLLAARVSKLVSVTGGGTVPSGGTGGIGERLFPDEGPRPLRVTRA